MAPPRLPECPACRTRVHVTSKGVLPGDWRHRGTERGWPGTHVTFVCDGVMVPREKYEEMRRERRRATHARKAAAAAAAAAA
eukprot:CAMPEP_0119480440 /NCGR_PEP_ID=MMETSP1344-20130328/9245_1 /TAXON_ID=236787 /ORGANISM="Florenciella parvula, Strain CCMP2471" /LENGTH=81 /DNA_ID=CAMNT_0007514747 /DNA_START=145 /DNA_END=387 /DNA_ORIENTATION=+